MTVGPVWAQLAKPRAVLWTVPVPLSQDCPRLTVSVILPATSQAPSYVYA